MNKLKRWLYELTEKQVNKITLIVIIITSLLSVVNFFTTYSLGRLPKEVDSFVIYVFALCLIPLLLAIMVYSALWLFPPKQEYLWKKKHDDIVIPRVRERFGLGPEFKEVLYVPSKTDYDFINFLKLLNELEVKYFAEEINGVILVSIRNKDGEELELQKIENYNFFDLNFKPKK